MTSTCFRNATILDGTGAAPYAGDLLVDGNRIAAVLPPGRAPATPAGQVIECNGATLMPGLIEPHAHLSFVDLEACQRAYEQGYRFISFGTILNHGMQGIAAELKRFRGLETRQA